MTRNFVSAHFWDLVLSGSDHLVAHNTLWRNTGQEGREPGWNAWLPAERVVFVNNILNSAVPVFGDTGKESTFSHNAYLSAAPHKQDAHPIDLRQRDAAVDAWIERLDEAVAQIDAAFDEDVEKVHANALIEPAFDVLREPPPQSSGLAGAGLEIGLLPKGSQPHVGRSVPRPPDFWNTFDRLELRHFDRYGEVNEAKTP